MQHNNWQQSFSSASLGLHLLKFEKFSRIHRNKARSGNVSLHSVGSVSQVIVLG